MRVLLLILALLAAWPAEAGEIVRDPAQVRLFRKLNACPATGKTTGACRGWVVDHSIPLCLQPLVTQSLDVPANMRWMDKAEALKKDRLEWEACRKLKALQR